ncbi:hypothetical protein [Spirosoma sp. KUDC1026]|nr:hypothetical protein [Spirosoma sp. KUDC1026]
MASGLLLLAIHAWVKRPQDERFAAVVGNKAGESGAALSRR